VSSGWMVSGGRPVRSRYRADQVKSGVVSRRVQGDCGLEGFRLSSGSTSLLVSWSSRPG